MNSVTDLYKTLANANGRTLDIVVNIDGVDYDSEVIEFNIQEELDSTDIVVGQAPSARLSLKLQTTTYISSKAPIKPYVRFLGTTNSEWVQLGLFYCDNRYVNRGITSITAYDKMLYLDQTFVSELTYPATIQAVLNEIATNTGITIAFTPQAFSIDYPITDYTYRETLGYIASMHGGNAIFNNVGAFTVTNFGTADAIALKTCTDQDIDNESFKLTRVVCVKDVNNTFELGEGTDYHTLAFSNPFMSQESINYIYAKLNGLTCNNLTVTKQGSGIYQLGELSSTLDNNNQTASVNLIISYIEYDFSENKFTETIKSNIRTESQAEYVKETDVKSIINNTTSTYSEAIYGYSNLIAKKLSTTENAIITLKFTTAADCTPIFDAEINAVITTGGTIYFLYYLDDIIYHIKPIQTVSVGYHVIHLFTPLEFEKNTAHTLKVTAYTDGAVGYCNKQQINAVVKGQGLSAISTKWDGTFTIKEVVGDPIIFGLPNFSVSAISETITTVTDTPTNDTVSEVIAPIPFSSSMSVSGITATVSTALT